MTAHSPASFIGFALYARLARRTFFPGSDKAVGLTLARFIRMVRFVPVFFLTQVWHRAWLRLDDFLFPAYRAIEVKNPVFVCGMPRCGTTLLHRVLAEDSRTTSFRLWELVFAPSICQRRFFRALGHIDRALGGHVKRRVRALFLRLASDMQRYHSLDLWEAEEDDLVLMPFIASAFLFFPFPYYDLLRPLARFDAEIPCETRRRVMGHYKGLIQRHLFVYGPHKRFLSKNPVMSAKVESIRETFPDARIVCNVRTPHEAVPSMLSLFRYMIAFFKYDAAQPEIVAHKLELADYFYAHPMDCLPKTPDHLHSFVRYPDLVQALRGTVEELYGRLELEMDDAFRTRLEELEDQSRAFKSQHTYSLEEFGLTRDEIAQRYEAVFRTFDFDPAA